MPAEFRDETIRNFYRVKFEQFAHSSGGFILKDNSYKGRFLSSRIFRAQKNADFAEEYKERREAELEYDRGRCKGVVDEEEADIEMELSSNGDLPPVMIDFSTEEIDDRGINNPSFDREVDRAQKHVVDAREVCLIDWEVRDNAQGLLEKLCFCMN